jgi:hypothetical protein
VEFSKRGQSSANKGDDSVLHLWRHAARWLVAALEAVVTTKVACERWCYSEYEPSRVKPPFTILLFEKLQFVYLGAYQEAAVD